jgi:uncharacterized protein YabN with tetrapyrrole methylase and pyrophosphatase domain
MKMNTEELAQSFIALIELVFTLRGPAGCPWDRQQTDDTIKMYLLEEAYEVLDAVEKGIPADVCQELGDLLFQIIFLSTLAQERNEFTLLDIMDRIQEKMIHRHPHVFGQVRVNSAEEVSQLWEKIKDAEKGGSQPWEKMKGAEKEVSQVWETNKGSEKGSQNGEENTDSERHAPLTTSTLLEKIPVHLPALLMAHRLGQRASKVDFDWETRDGVWAKVKEEMTELEAAIGSRNVEHIGEEVGDLLFSLTHFARHYGLNAEHLLRDANHKFIRRFREMEQALKRAGSDLEKATPDEMNKVWDGIRRPFHVNKERR